MLSYLQMDACLPGLPPLLASLPDIRATLHLAFHKTDPEVLAGSSPLAAQVLKSGKHRQGKYTASIPQLARDLNETFAAVQEELQALARAGEVSFTLSDQAVCYQVCRSRLVFHWSTPLMPCCVPGPPHAARPGGAGGSPGGQAG